jgi:hypothetical protein
MLVSLFMGFETVYPLRDERRMTARQSVYLVIESGTLSQKFARELNADRALRALSDSSHATTLFPY